MDGKEVTAEGRGRESEVNSTSLDSRLQQNHITLIESLKWLSKRLNKEKSQVCAFTYIGLHHQPWWKMVGICFFKIWTRMRPGDSNSSSAHTGASSSREPQKQQQQPASRVTASSSSRVAKHRGKRTAMNLLSELFVVIKNLPGSAVPFLSWMNLRLFWDGIN